MNAKQTGSAPQQVNRLLLPTGIWRMSGHPAPAQPPFRRLDEADEEEKMSFTFTYLAGQGFYLFEKTLPQRYRSSFAGILYKAAYSMLPESHTRWRAMTVFSKKQFAAVALGSIMSRSRAEVLKAAKQVYGSEWNAFSDALDQESVCCFERTIRPLSEEFGCIDYLEIGSAQGISMGLIGFYLQQLDRLGTLVSIDPYLDNGYVELGRDNALVHVTIDKRSKQAAQRLYGLLGLDVNIMETTSHKALVNLLKENRKFHLIYIDGYHTTLTPAVDFGLSYNLLHDGGAIMLDDHICSDIYPIKTLCDRNCEKIAESWKVASYRMRSACAK